MRKIYGLLVSGLLISFSSGCTQVPKSQIIHLYDFSRDQVALFSIGMQDLACMKLDTIRSDQTKTILRCLPTPEQKVFGSIGRVLIKYEIKASYDLNDDGTIEIR
jgi:hypothetical protein